MKAASNQHCEEIDMMIIIDDGVDSFSTCSIRTVRNAGYGSSSGRARMRVTTWFGSSLKGLPLPPKNSCALIM